MKQAGYLLAGLLVGFLLAGLLLVATRLPSGRPVTLEPPPTKAPIEVHVVGAVLRPGLYMFPEGSRVQDAIEAAGGLTSEADLTNLNLAAKLEDGQQLEIGGASAGAATPKPTAGFRVIPSGPTATPGADLININTASADKLATLPGIGPTIAQRIVDYRTAHGPFTRTQDLMNVAGIGLSTYDAIKNLITV